MGSRWGADPQVLVVQHVGIGEEGRERLKKCRMCI